MQRDLESKRLRLMTLWLRRDSTWAASCAELEYDTAKSSGGSLADIHVWPLQVEKKVFYLDLKSNPRGMALLLASGGLLVCEAGAERAGSGVHSRSGGIGTFLKLSEKGANRERSTIAVPGTGIAWFREIFGFYASELDQGRSEGLPQAPLRQRLACTTRPYICLLIAGLY